MGAAEADMVQAEVDLIQGDPNGMDPGIVEAAPPEVPREGDAPVEVFTFVEQMPEFNGNLNDYLNKNLIYPKAAKDAKIEGKVVVQFIVNETGSISNASVIKKIGWGMDEEAIRVVSNMPNWKPGKQNGRPVKTRYTLPITFKLVVLNSS